VCLGILLHQRTGHEQYLFQGLQSLLVVAFFVKRFAHEQEGGNKHWLEAF